MVEVRYIVILIGEGRLSIQGLLKALPVFGRVLIHLLHVHFLRESLTVDLWICHIRDRVAVPTTCPH